MGTLTYKEAGVDIDAGEALVQRIKPLAAATTIPEAMTGLGGFAALCGLPEGMKEPVLVSGTDGVGTKLLVAQAAGRHDTVGIDLVAMCVNDVLTSGARPLFFLDYYSTGALNVDVATAVVAGIAEGCKQAGCALLGGETAEHPGGHGGDSYDVAGFSVGVVERSAILPRKDVTVGDTLIGVQSTGLHSNGYSLARKVLLELAELPLDEQVPELGETLADAMLRPTRIYAKAMAAMMATGHVKAVCHVTGGGLPGNVPRVLPEGLGARFDSTAWERAPIFDLIEQRGEIARSEMFRTFNMGLGLVVVCEQDRVDEMLSALREAGETATVVGSVIATDQEGEARVEIL